DPPQVKVGCTESGAMGREPRGCGGKAANSDRNEDARTPRRWCPSWIGTSFVGCWHGIGVALSSAGAYWDNEDDRSGNVDQPEHQWCFIIRSIIPPPRRARTRKCKRKR